jgi:hypothetical protein
MSILRKQIERLADDISEAMGEELRVGHDGTEYFLQRSVDSAVLMSSVFPDIMMDRQRYFLKGYLMGQAATLREWNEESKATNERLQAMLDFRGY